MGRLVSMGQPPRGNVVNILRCEHCASTDLTRLSDGEYRCNHCKSNLHLAAPIAPPPKPTGYRPSTGFRPRPPLTSGQKVLVTLLMVAAVIGIAALRVKRDERRRDELRRRMIQRDVAASLNRRLGITHGLGSTPAPIAKPPEEYGAAAIEPPKVIRAEFGDAVALPDRIGNLYLVGLVKNTGEAPIDHPRVEATLWDASHRKLAVGFGFSAIPNLLPKEEFPVKILIQHAPKYDSITYQIVPKAMSYGTPQRFQLSVESPKLGPGQFGGYRLSGMIRNTDKVSVQHGRIVALLLGEDRSIVGMHEAFAGQQMLPAGDECPFDVQISTVSGTPKSFRIYTTAMSARP